MNKIKLIGRLTKTPIMNKTNTGKDVVNIYIAVETKKTKVDTNILKEVDYFSIVIFGELAVLINKVYKKGDLVEIDGKVKTKNWYDKNDNKMYGFDVIASKITKL